MKKKWIVRTLVLLSMSLVSAACHRTPGSGTKTGVRDGNAGGLAEANVAYVYLHADAMIEFCLSQADVCDLSAAERATLQEIVANLPTERATPDQLVFLTAEEAPDRLVVNEKPVPFATDAAVGSILLFNRDMLYFKDELGTMMAGDLPFAFALLTEALSQHSATGRTLDVAARQSLGAKVAASSAAQVESASFGRVFPNTINADARPTLSILHLGDTDATYRSVTMLFDGSATHEVSAMYLAKLPCAEGLAATRFIASNPFFSFSEYHSEEGVSGYDLWLRTTFVWRCSDAPDAAWQGPKDAVMTFGVRRQALVGELKVNLL